MVNKCVDKNYFSKNDPNKNRLATYCPPDGDNRGDGCSIGPQRWGRG